MDVQRRATGMVTAVRGGVIDIDFAGELPRLDEALLVDRDRDAPLLAEVQQHVDERSVRAVPCSPPPVCVEGPRCMPQGVPSASRSAMRYSVG